MGTTNSRIEEDRIALEREKIELREKELAQEKELKEKALTLQEKELAQEKGIKEKALAQEKEIKEKELNLQRGFSVVSKIKGFEDVNRQLFLLSSAGGGFLLRWNQYKKYAHIRNAMDLQNDSKASQEMKHNLATKAGFKSWGHFNQELARHDPTNVLNTLKFRSIVGFSVPFLVAIYLGRQKRSVGMQKRDVD